MKNSIRYLMILAVWLLTSVAMWAGGQVSIVKSGQGELTYKVEKGLCTLTATPADGYFITAAHISVVKTIEGGSAHAPRRTPSIAEPIALTALTPDGAPNLETQYQFEMPGDDYDVQVTAAFQDVVLRIGSTVVYEGNRKDVLKDGGSVQFDGKGQLKLTGASLNVPIITTLQELTIYLEDANKIEVENVAAIQGQQTILVFTTQGNSPGTLMARTTVKTPVFDGITTVDFQQNLILLAGSFETELITIGTPIGPLSTEEDKEVVVPVDNQTGDDLRNTVVENVLYTLENDEYQYDTSGGANSIVLQSTMVEDDINETLTSYQPGSSDFAQNFSGLTFMVAAGTGTIIITARTGERGVLNVQVGNQPATSITGAIDFTEFRIPYACTEASYVLIYNASPVENSANSNHRAGKKTSVTVGLSSVGVNASNVQSSNSSSVIAGDEVGLTDENIIFDVSLGSVQVDNAQVNSLPDAAFEEFSFLKYIDLRNTSITGLYVSRADGPFAGVSENTIIYLPAGNTTDEPNVVIGSVCENVVLDANMDDDESFGLNGSFVAQWVELDRLFALNEMSTVYLPFDIKADALSEYGRFYEFDAIDGSSVKLKEVTGDLIAHQPYFFKSNFENTVLYSQVATMAMPQSAGTRRRALGNGFQGCYDTFYAGVETNIYRFEYDQQSDNVSFVRMHDGECIKPFQAYLVADSDEETLVVDADGITAIAELHSNSSDNGSWVTLDGRRLQQRPTAKGLYLWQGRKYLIP